MIHLRTAASRLALTTAAIAAISMSAFCASAMAASVEVSETKTIIDHVTVSSSKPYALVKQDLESRLGRLDDHIRTLLKQDKVDELRTALQKAAGNDGLVIHYIGLHGDWLVLKG
ncbi:DUF302 domain-containing protein, partial [Paraburkholderia sp. SIMBA_055]